MHDANDPTLTGGGPATEADLPASRRVGDYDLGDELARGAMGVVFRARQRSLNRPVALKMILSGEFASPIELQRFRQEAEAAARLDHPNILPIYEVGEHEGRAYFSMKLAERGTLADRIGEVRKDLPTAVRIVEQVARGVHHAHQRGILHRDLKPANVLLADPEDSGASHVPLVADFGLAKRTEGDSTLTQSGAIVGTPSYMAPEQARGSKVVTTAADTYALGAILYEVLAGRPPFRGTTVAQTLHMVEHDEPVRPRSVNAAADADLEAVALKCLEKDPSLRYETAGALADELASWLRGEPVAARRAGWGRRARKWVRRNPAVAALSVAVVLALVAGSVVSSVYAVRAGQRATEARDSEREVRRREAALQDSLAIADFQQARAQRLAGQPGWRAKSLELVARSAGIRSRPRADDDPPLPVDLPEPGDLRSEAVMALVAEDARPVRTLASGLKAPVFNGNGTRLFTLAVRIEDEQFVAETVDLRTGESSRKAQFHFDPDAEMPTMWIMNVEALDDAGERVACVEQTRDKPISIRDLASGKSLASLTSAGAKAEERMPEWVRFTADGRRLLAARRFKNETDLVVWDIDRPDAPRTIDRRTSKIEEIGMRSVGFPHGEYRTVTMSPDSSRVAFCSADGATVLVRGLARDVKEVTLAAGAKAVALSWHPTLPRLAVLTSGPVAVTLHDLDAGKPVLRREIGPAVTVNDRHASLAYNRAGDRIALVDGPSAPVRVLDAEDLSERVTLLDQSLLGVAGLFWTADDDLAVSHFMEEMRVYRLDRGEGTAAVPGFRPAGRPAFSRDGRWLAAFAPTKPQTTTLFDKLMLRGDAAKHTTYDRVALVDRRTNRVARWLPGTDGAFGHLFFTHDSRRVWVCHAHRLIEYDIDSGAEVARHAIDGTMPIASFDHPFLLPDGRLAAVSNLKRGDGVEPSAPTPIVAYDVAGRRVLAEFKQEGSGMIHAHVAPGGDRVLIASRLPAFREQPPPSVLRELPGGAELGRFPGVPGMIVSDLAAMTSDRGAFLIIDVRRSGQSLRSATWEVRDLRNGAALMTIPNTGIPDSTVAFSPDGRFLALATDRGQVEVWDVEAKAMLFRWMPHAGKTVTTVSMTPEGDVVTSGLNDDRLAILKWSALRERMTALGLGW